LFLQRGGDGQRTLAEEAISLSSWINGSDADPELLAQIDVNQERLDFQGKELQTPEEWLLRWRNDSLPKTASNFRIAYRAMLLETP
jgi:hypothetical protein